ncbi:hypothetical protein [Sphingobium sp. TomTYG45]
MNNRVAPFVVPDGELTDYDLLNLAAFAALLDAAKAGQDWRDAASTILGLDVSEAGAEACWRSHLERGRWIVGEGLGQAIEAFGRPALDP